MGWTGLGLRVWAGLDWAGGAKGKKVGTSAGAWARHHKAWENIRALEWPGLEPNPTHINPIPTRFTWTLGDGTGLDWAGLEPEAIKNPAEAGLVE